MLKPDPLSDADFLLAKQGDHTAFNKIMLLYSSSIYTRALRLANSADEAKDISQQTFIKLYTHISGIEHKKALGSWLRRTAVNIFIDEYRKKRPTVNVDDAECLSTLEYQLLHRDLTAHKFDLEYYLSQLNDTERLVIWLYSVEGYLHKEIAEKLDISLSNSKQILRRSLVKLRNLQPAEDSNDVKRVS